MAKVKFECRFCKLRFEVESWEECNKIQSTQCYVTIKGVSHSLVGVTN